MITCKFNVFVMVARPFYDTSHEQNRKQKKKKDKFHNEAQLIYTRDIQIVSSGQTFN